MIKDLINITGLIDEFRNEVLCRNDHNQDKARKIWITLSPLLTSDEVKEVKDYWVHYTGSNDEIKTNDFGTLLKQIHEKYK